MSPGSAGDSVTWWGHSTASIRIGGVHLLTDPVLRSHVGPLRWYGPTPPVDLTHHVDAVLISHLHRDHLDLPSLRRLDSQTPIVVPRGAAQLVATAARGPVIEMEPGEVVRFGDITVRAVPAAHGHDRDSFHRRPRAEPLGYVLDGPSRVYFAGDTGLFDGFRTVGPDIDLALLPIGGWGLTLGDEHLSPRPQ